MRSSHIAYFAIVIWAALLQIPGARAQGADRLAGIQDPAAPNALAVISIRTNKTAGELPLDAVIGASVKNSSGDPIGEVARVARGARAVIALDRPVDPERVQIEIPLDRLIFESDGHFILSLADNERSGHDE
ncbi:MAG: hypothetical protein Tsb0010_05190 [Parvularculaceae bacterium]